jgi:hypothetical protein
LNNEVADIPPYFSNLSGGGDRVCVLGKQQ